MKTSERRCPQITTNEEDFEKVGNEFISISASQNMAMCKDSCEIWKLLWPGKCVSMEYNHHEDCQITFVLLLYLHGADLCTQTVYTEQMCCHIQTELKIVDAFFFLFCPKLQSEYFTNVPSIKEQGWSMLINHNDILSISDQSLSFDSGIDVFGDMQWKWFLIMQCSMTVLILFVHSDLI